MTPHAAPILTAEIEKLTDSCTWLRRIKTPRWKLKVVQLRSDATVAIRPPGISYAHVPLTPLLLVPGGARHATHAEQLLYGGRHVFVLVAVPLTDAHDHDAKRRTVYFRGEGSEEWVKRANEVSYGRFEMGGGGELLRPFLMAWGHVTKLSGKQVIEVARVLNFKLAQDDFAETWMQLHGEPVPKLIGAEQFMNVMAHYAVASCLDHLAPDIRKGERCVAAGSVAEWLEEPVEVTKKRLADCGLDRFTPRFVLHLLFNANNSVIDAEKAAAKHDMSQPLNRYLISSSHNTYLTGDQLKSDSTAEMYRVVLERGCRCVEIDVWDGDNGVPIVRHGHTMTSTETLRNVLIVLKENAFTHGNHFPVILSIENHMEKPQQLVAARQIRQIFGDMLYAPGAAARDCEVLPSPVSLINKIVIKAKTGLTVLQPELRTEGLPQGSLDFEDDDSDESADSQEPRSQDRTSSTSVSSNTGVRKHKSEPKENNVIPEFAELVFLSGGNRKALTALWKSGNSGKTTYLAASCVSINEKKLEEAYLNKSADVVRDYNSHGLTRVYPKGSRVDSSNYIPVLAHFLGCQITALNWQTHDAGLACNEAQFLGNGGTGYLLPQAMPSVECAGNLEITILSAFLLPKPKKTLTIARDIIDPYCILKVYDAVFTEDDEYSFKLVTDAAKSNGFAPAWHKQFTVHIQNRELAVIYFRVYDFDHASGDDLVGYVAVPVRLMRTGVRSLPLKSKDGVPLSIPGTSQHPSILCAIQWV